MNYKIVKANPGASARITAADVYQSEDCYTIVNSHGVYVFSFSDPGHGGVEIEIKIDKEADDFARINNPTFEQFISYLLERGFKL